jgi:hypothetical protein
MQHITVHCTAQTLGGDHLLDLGSFMEGIQWQHAMQCMPCCGGVLVPITCSRRPSQDIRHLPWCLRRLPHLSSSSCSAVQDLDTDNPHIELNGLKYAAKYEDTVGSLLVCSSTAEPEAAEEEAAAAAAPEDADAGGAAGEQAQAAAKEPDVSLVVCEKRLVAQLIPTEPGPAAAAAQATATPAGAAGAEAGVAAEAEGAGAAAAGDAPQQMEVD